MREGVALLVGFVLGAVAAVLVIVGVNPFAQQEGAGALSSPAVPVSPAPAPAAPPARAPAAPAPAAPVADSLEPLRVQSPLREVRVVSVRFKRYGDLETRGFAVSGGNTYALGFSAVLPDPADEPLGVEIDEARTDTGENLAINASPGGWTTLSRDGTRLFWEKELHLPSRRATRIERLAGRVWVRMDGAVREQPLGPFATDALETLPVAQWYTVSTRADEGRLFRIDERQLLLRIRQPIREVKELRIYDGNGEGLAVGLPQRGGGKAKGSFVVLDFEGRPIPPEIGIALVLPADTDKVAYPFVFGGIPIQGGLRPDVVRIEEVEIF